MGSTIFAARHTLFLPPLWGTARQGGTTNTGVRDLPPSLIPHKGGGDEESASGLDKVSCSSFIRQ
jgi:hypothetical protein